MSLEMHLSAHQKLAQQLKMSPQMYQTIQMLQYPLLELREKIEQEFTENPFLEIVEERPSPDEMRASEGEMVIEGSQEDLERRKREEVRDIIEALREEWEEGRSLRSAPRGAAYSGDEDPKRAALESYAAPSVNLADHLLLQLHLLGLDPRLETAVEILIRMLDRNGYLPEDYLEAVKELAEKDDERDEEAERFPRLPEGGFSEEEIEKAVEVLQSLDPPGIGARSMTECLLLQLDRLEGDYEVEKRIVKEHLELLAANKLPEIAKELGVPLERVKEAADFIRRNLNPKPGLLFDSEPPSYVVADVIIRERDGELEVSLNEQELPRLRFKRKYLSMLSKVRLNKKEKEFVSSKKESARWLLNAIDQRNRTLYRIAEAVARHQRDFFLKGKRYLKPLLMKDLAEELGIDVSIVSRAVSGKYVDCPQGIIPLRSLFTGGYRTAGGEEISDEAIKEEIRLLIAKEDKRKPLSDEAIMRELRKKNIDIKRRTVTKYRAELGIPNTRERKVH